MGSAVVHTFVSDSGVMAFAFDIVRGNAGERVHSGVQGARNSGLTKRRRACRARCRHAWECGVRIRRPKAHRCLRLKQPAGQYHAAPEARHSRRE